MKEYKTIKEILEDLINREIGKSEAEKAIEQFNGQEGLIAEVNQVLQTRDITRPGTYSSLVLETDRPFDRLQQVFLRGRKVKIILEK